MAFTGDNTIRIFDRQNIKKNESPENIDIYFDELFNISEKQKALTPRDYYIFDFIDNEDRIHRGKVECVGFKEILTLVLDDGSKVRCTHGQNLMLTDGNFLNAINCEGFSLLSPDGETYHVSKVIITGEKEEVFTFKFQDKIFTKGIVSNLIVESNNNK